MEIPTTDVDQGGGQGEEVQPEPGQEAQPAPQSTEAAPESGSGDGQETVTIAGKEYPADQVAKALENAGQYDELLPEYTRTSQLLKDPQKLIQRLQQNFPDALPQTQSGQQPQGGPDLRQALGQFGDEGVKFGETLVSHLRESLGNEILDGVEQLLGNRLTPIEDQLTESQINSVNKEFSLTNADSARILRFMQQNNIGNYRHAAVIARHEGLVKAAEERGRQQAGGKGPTPAVPTGGSGKDKPGVKPYDPKKDKGKSLDELMDEGLRESGA